MNYAYVYYFSDSSKLSAFIVSYESLKATHPKYPIYCMLGEACINQKFVDFLTSIGVGFLICDTPCSIATRNSSGIRTSTFDVAGKMDIFLHTQFDKIVCIDTDTYINQNIDDDSIIYFFKPRVLYLNTNVYSYTGDNNASTIDLADYVLFWCNDFQDNIKNVVVNSEKFELIYQNNQFTLYKSNL